MSNGNRYLFFRLCSKSKMSSNLIIGRRYKLSKTRRIYFFNGDTLVQIHKDFLNNDCFKLCIPVEDTYGNSLLFEKYFEDANQNSTLATTIPYVPASTTLFEDQVLSNTSSKSESQKRSFRKKDIIYDSQRVMVLIFYQI